MTDLDFDFGFTAVTEDELEAVQKTKVSAEGAQEKTGSREERAVRIAATTNEV